MNAILCFVTKQFGAVPKELAQDAASVNPCENLDIVPDIQYQNHNQVPLAMDLYRPKHHSGDALPVIVVVHGGNQSISAGKCRCHVPYLTVVCLKTKYGKK